MGAGPSTPRGDFAEDLLAGLDAACGRAARLISEADIFLLTTGAGFSADSGLAIYADVAKVKAYSDRRLQYHDICQPRWLQSDPGLFWGFWGQCYNDYRATAPHPGYEIINGWVDRFRHSTTADEIREKIKERKAAKTSESGPEQSTTEMQPYIVEENPGAFFVFTSNVDAHHFDWFRACEIRECHGNTEIYQCSELCGANVWRIPRDFRFIVDKETMLAPDCPAASSSTTAPSQPAGEESKGEEEGVVPALQRLLPEASGEAPSGEVPAESAAEKEEPDAQANEDAGEGQDQGDTTMEEEEAAREPARVGRVWGKLRETTLKYMPDPPPGTCFKGFETNHPKCPYCGAEARPAILMFGDMSWQDVTPQQKQWSNWRKAVKAHVEEVTEAGKTIRAVVLEIGAGGNVTTVRNQSEEQLRQLLMAGADAHLVRVNPEYPLGDEDAFSPDGTNCDNVVSVMSRGLDAINRIERALVCIREADQATDRPMAETPIEQAGQEESKKDQDQPQSMED